MAELSELERRINAALDRIGTGLGALAKPAPTPPVPEAAAAPAIPVEEPTDLASLKEALDAERTANAQLSERVRGLRERQEEQVRGLSQEVEELRARSENLAGRNRVMKRRMDVMRTALRTLRAASAGGSAEPHLINQAMMAETEGLHALRDADRTELDALLEEMRPIVGEASHV